MFRVFDGQSADEVWLEIAATCSSYRETELRSSRGGPVLELGHVCLSISDPRQRWVVSREPALNPAFAIAEIVWIVNGRNDASFLNYFNRQLPHFAGEVDEYPGAYGHRLRCNLGFDQLDRAYTVLKKNSDTRQVVLQIWDGGVDFPHQDGSPSSSDVPCNVVSLLKVRDGRLQWTQVLRSNDLFLGLPHNLIQFTSLQEVIAGWLGVDCGAFHLVTDSLHVYEENLPLLQAADELRPMPNTDILSLPRRESESSFKELADFIDLIQRPAVEGNDIYEFVKRSELPAAFANLLCILAAEGLRRRKSNDLVKEILNRCTNHSLIQVWDRWITRIRNLQSTHKRSTSNRLAMPT